MKIEKFILTFATILYLPLRDLSSNKKVTVCREIFKKESAKCQRSLYYRGSKYSYFVILYTLAFYSIFFLLLSATTLSYCSDKNVFFWKKLYVLIVINKVCRILSVEWFGSSCCGNLRLMDIFFFKLHLSQHTVKWDVCVDRGHSMTTLTIRGGWGSIKKSIRDHILCNHL